MHSKCKLESCKLQSSKYTRYSEFSYKTGSRDEWSRERTVVIRVPLIYAFICKTQDRQKGILMN